MDDDILSFNSEKAKYLVECVFRNTAQNVLKDILFEIKEKATDGFQEIHYYTNSEYFEFLNFELTNRGFTFSFNSDQEIVSVSWK